MVKRGEGFEPVLTVGELIETLRELPPELPVKDLYGETVLVAWYVSSDGGGVFVQ